MKKDRKAFEAVIARKYPGWAFERDADGGYVESWVDGAWIGWCERATLDTMQNKGNDHG